MQHLDQSLRRTSTPSRPYARTPARFFPRIASGRMLSILASLFLAPTLHADAPAFDLVGPKVDVHVQRMVESQPKTLPIAEVPNLLPGDRLWIHPDLPESQSTHYVLVVAFLRGSTNPPPNDWYRRVETWSKSVREEGIFVVVPQEAQQALIFLAPETPGDFATLRKAVHDRPGAFVRAAQDLQQASWDRLRLDAYLAVVKKASLGDPKDLKQQTALAARTLGIRVEQQCFDKPTEQQAPCLVQHTDGLVLDDSNAQSMVNQMANGAGGDMMNQISYSTLGGAGAFSPYVGAVLDMVRIFSSVRTAKYQYIPALALPQTSQGDTLNLRLNVPPSFRDPKSVIVVALPPIGPPTGPSQPPMLRAPDVAQNVAPEYCASKPKLTLLAEGAPLAFATDLAWDLHLHIDTKAQQPPTANDHPEISIDNPFQPDPKHDPPTPGAHSSTHQALQNSNQNSNQETGQPSGIDIPLKPDPLQGGFILASPIPLLPEAEASAELRGKWGFDDFTGPRYHLRSSHPGGWTIQPTDLNALITGREDTLHVDGANTLCVSEVQAIIPEDKAAESKNPQDKKHTTELKLTWKSPKPDQLDISVPLKDAAPGKVTIAIHQYGLAKPDDLPLKAYTEAAALDHITLSAGDKVAVLKGRRLDEVESADLAGITFAPSALNRVEDFDQLELAATGNTETLRPGDNYSAKVLLRDGRTLRVPATVTPARPQIELLSKGIQHQEASAANPTSEAVSTNPANPNANTANPTNPNDLPLQSRLVFFLRSRLPANFPRSEKVEIAAVDGSFHTMLTLSDGLMLEDAHTAVATIDPLARFGASAFGPIQLRAVSQDGVTGDWVPLGTLVRLPGLKDLRCPRNINKSCQLSGENLFLITAVGSNPEMTNAVDVPSEFTGTALTVPNIPRANQTSATSPANSTVGASSTLGTLYVRLRDDPDTVQPFTLPIISTTPQPATPIADQNQATPPQTTPTPDANAAKSDTNPNNPSESSQTTNQPHPKI